MSMVDCVLWDLCKCCPLGFLQCLKFIWLQNCISHEVPLLVSACLDLPHFILFSTISWSQGSKVMLRGIRVHSQHCLVNQATGFNVQAMWSWGTLTYHWLDKVLCMKVTHPGLLSFLASAFLSVLTLQFYPYCGCKLYCSELRQPYLSKTGMLILGRFISRSRIGRLDNSVFHYGVNIHQCV